MSEFIADIQLPERLDEEFLELIPNQQKIVDKWLKKGKILNYILSQDRRRLWIVIAAHDIVEARNIIGTFPIFKHIKVRVYETLFHRTADNSIPQMWLN
ncbi:MAG: hypothetical protein JXJ22_10820 [Bacteroidales bacterium]|nr:hypothetical protein [Bacteroidales bacterium]